VKDLDISILINNAGLMTNRLFLNLSAKEAADMIDVNVMHVIMMTKKFINKLLERK
jgi:short-subunit dehydrogenase